MRGFLSSNQGGPLASAVRDLTEAWAHVVEATAGGGVVSAVLHGPGAPIAQRHARHHHYAASTLKLAVLVAALEESLAGRLALDSSLAVGRSFRSATGSRFALRQLDDQDDATWESLGSHLPVSVLLERMIVESSNIATNLIVDRIGFGPVRHVIAKTCPGQATLARLIGDDRAERIGVTNTVSAAGLAQLMHALARGSLLPPTETERALDLLGRQRHRGMIPAGVPAGTWTAGKSGWNEHVRHDVALVRPPLAPPYVLAVCTSTSLGVGAEPVIARLSELTWEQWCEWHA